MNCLDILTRIAQVFTGIAALFVSCLALYFTLRESRRKADHDRLLVRPYLVGVSDKRPTPEINPTAIRFGFSIKNAGLGPAKIQRTIFLLNDVEQQVSEANDIGRLVIQCLGLYGPSKVDNQYVQPNYLLGAKEELRLLNFELPKHIASKPEILQQLRTLRLIVRYESLYGEKCEYDSHEMATPSDGTRMW